MPRHEFITLPEKLVAVTLALATDLRSRGYSVKFEPNDVSHPSTPALLAKRNHEKLYVLVADNFVSRDVKNWRRYCQSCQTDTRIAICLESNRPPTQARIADLQAQGIGLVSLIAKRFHWSSEARDIAFHAELPERADLQPKVRKLLGEALDRFQEHDWRTGFENACLVLEDESRKYLVRNVGLGRVKYSTGRKIIAPTKAQIRRMTLGGLKAVFCNLVRQNQVEAQLCGALDTLNPGRVTRIHDARNARAERKLRRQVGVQMWTIIKALEALAPN